MTYDVPRYDSDGWRDPGGQWVLAADAEAHEIAALTELDAAWQERMNALRLDAEAHEKAESRRQFLQGWGEGHAEAREQAIRDCIAAVEAFDHDPLCMGDDIYCCSRNCTLAVLRGLLAEGSES